MAQLKAFITLDKDNLRMPYARKNSTFARRTVFFGSVNPREFLHDPTGNTRFWTVPCVEIDFRHQIDMQQVWAEVRAMQLDGFGYNLTAEETARLNVTNDDYASIEPIEERMLTQLDWDADRDTWVWQQATDILLSIGIDRPVTNDARKAAAIARKMNGGAAKRTGNHRLLLVPPKKIVGFA
jgi:putative DNA primase/helicase